MPLIAICERQNRHYICCWMLQGTIIHDTMIPIRSWSYMAVRYQGHVRVHRNTFVGFIGDTIETQSHKAIWMNKFDNLILIHQREESIRYLPSRTINVCLSKFGTASIFSSVSSSNIFRIYIFYITSIKLSDQTLPKFVFYNGSPQTLFQIFMRLSKGFFISTKSDTSRQHLISWSNVGQSFVTRIHWFAKTLQMRFMEWTICDGLYVKIRVSEANMLEFRRTFIVIPQCLLISLSNSWPVFTRSCCFVDSAIQYPYPMSLIHIVEKWAGLSPANRCDEYVVCVLEWMA